MKTFKSLILPLIISISLIMTIVTSTVGGVFLLTSMTSCSYIDVKKHDSKAWNIAMSMKVTGKHVLNECLPFALDLNQKLHAAGVESRIVGFYYQTDPFGGEIFGHAVVLYTDEGAQYMMDNQSFKPTRISGKTDLERARWFYAIAGGNAFDVLSTTGDAKNIKNLR